MKHLPIFLAMLFPAIGYAQHKTIEKSILECVYLEKVVVDTTSKRVVPDTLYLKVGETSSAFYSQDKFFTDSLKLTKDGEKRLRELQFQYARNGKINELTSNTGEYIYMNYPEGYTTVRADLSGQAVEFKEERELPVWKLIEGEKIIHGYKCQMAETDFRGRKWIAWYAVDIPVNAGPWKLWGLPGLIMETYDEHRHYEYSVVGVSSENLGEVVFFDMHRKYRKITRKDYLKSMANSGFLMNEQTRGLDELETLKSDRKYDSRETDYRE